MGPWAGGSSPSFVDYVSILFIKRIRAPSLSWRSVDTLDKERWSTLAACFAAMEELSLWVNLCSDGQTHVLALARRVAGRHRLRAGSVTQSAWAVQTAATPHGATGAAS